MKVARSTISKRREFVALVSCTIISTWESLVARFGPEVRWCSQWSCVAYRAWKNSRPEIRVPAFAVHTELPGPETVDFTPFIREDLLLNLPAHPRCDKDGNRVCKMKQPLTVKQDTKRKLDWSALDKLKIENR